MSSAGGAGGAGGGGGGGAGAGGKRVKKQDGRRWVVIGVDAEAREEFVRSIRLLYENECHSSSSAAGAAAGAGADDIMLAGIGSADAESYYRQSAVGSSGSITNTETAVHAVNEANGYPIAASATLDPTDLTPPSSRDSNMPMISLKQLPCLFSHFPIPDNFLSAVRLLTPLWILDCVTNYDIE